MGQIRCLFLILLFLIGGLSYSHSQISPPEPRAQNSGDGPPPCPVDDEEGVPPPVGLCLPIDDYVYLLMAIGVMYGCYKLRDFESAKTAP